ncbi:MAG: DNA polymerase I [Nesterenkonia sp.]|nr:DNA polymerase I [Nesterenkonia sp.]
MSRTSEARPETENRLLVVDGHSMAFRAFYALPVESFVTDTGQHTNAVHGFTNMLLKLIREELPTHVVLAFDLDTPTFRHESYDEYKGGRAKTPEEFHGQIDLIRQVAEAMRIPAVTVEGYEADDIVATFATRAEEAGWETLVVSGDKDTFQLVTERTSLLYPTSGITKLPIMDPAAVEEKYLVPPRRYPDLAALVGEAADNLPGVPKVGPKTAAKWLAQYGSTRGIIDHAEEIGGKVGENLRASLDDVERNLRLNLLVRDLELPLSLEDAALSVPDRAAVDPLFDALQFDQIRDRLYDVFAQRFPDSVEKDAPTRVLPEIRTATTPQDLEGLTAGPLGVALCLDRGWEDLSTKAKRDEAARWAEALAVVLAPPSEQDSDEPEPVVVVFLTAADEELDRALAEILADAAVPKLIHDLKDAGRRLAWRGLTLRGASEDSLISGYLIQPDRRNYAFDELVAQHLRGSADPADYVGGEGAGADGPADGDAVGGSAPDLFSTQDVLDGVALPTLQAAALRAHLMHPLSAALEQELEARHVAELLHGLEIPLAEVLLDMELTGIAVSRERLESLDADFEAAVERAAQGAYDAIGHEVNLGSPKQLQTVLFEELGLPPTRKTKTGYSTDVESLRELHARTEHPFLDHLMAHRDATKLRQTVTGLMDTVGDDDRIHTTYAQTVAATGRLSSLNPNLQNIPVRTAEGRRIRDAFVVGEDWETLLTADYSQIEMRIMAHLSGDDALIRAFRDGEDLHSFVGARVFGVSTDEVSSEMRAKVKAMSYGLAYGLSSFGLSKQLDIGVDEARELMTEYFERFGAVRDYLREVVEQARADGYTSTIWGRRRYLPDLTSDNRQLRQMAERAALNAPIQGSAADIIKRAMLDVDAALADQGLTSRMLLQVHDELILEVAPGEREQVETLLVDRMSGAAELSVPLDVNVGAGASWHEAAH